MPPHEPSQLAPYPKGINLPLIYCDSIELRMINILPLGLSRPPPASKFDKTAMLLGHMANFAMRWLKKWLCLWQNFSGALMKALLMSIAKGACRAASAAPLQKAKRPLEEEQLGRGESKLEDGEKQNWEVDHQGYLILNSCSQEEAESLTEDGYVGECPEEVMKGISGAKLNKTHLEDNNALCLVHHSISLNFENDWESSSDEDVGMEDAQSPETFPQIPLEGYCPQVFAKGLGARGHFEEEEGGSCSTLGEFGASENTFEGDCRQSLESPSIPQEHRHLKNMTPEEPSLESASDFSKDGEYLSQYRKAKENLGTPTISYGFKSPLVLSLFYSPSEEDDDDDDSEDWSSEDEMEETSQSYLDSAVSENVANSSGTEDKSQHRGFPENLCGSLFPSMDPLHSFCFSKDIQPPTLSPPETKNHKEITVSFYFKKPDSKPEEIHNSPKPSPHKDTRSATEYLPLRSCLLQTERNCDLVTTETSLVSQKESQMVKKVRFSPMVTVHRLVVWDYASRAARRGPWEEMARDRCRFRRRIAEVGAILGTCLETEHRAKAWRKIYGALDLLQLENDDSNSAGREVLCV